VQAAPHAPAFVALKIDQLLREACEHHGMDRFAFLQAERERAALIDHLGGCERIRTSPLPTVYSITIRQFIFFYLATLPLALLHKFDGGEWLVPVMTITMAYPVLALDQIGLELQRPFLIRSLNHLPLEDICATIDRNLLALLGAAEGRQVSDGGGVDGTTSATPSTSGSGGARSGPG
jgi:putative membrane protein